jgi:multiple sugar transport system substrate-binding protein
MKNINTHKILKGMTWDHVRGYDPMVATSEQFAETHPGIQINWEKRSLQAFADRPLEDMALEYDLMVIDHPHAGAAARNDLLLPFDNQGFDAELATLAKQSCGISHQSYEFDGHQWGLAIDAATPISTYRPDLIDVVPNTWQEVVSLSEKGQVIWPLIPINALMSFFNLLASIGEPFGKNGKGVDVTTGKTILTEMMAVTQNIPQECFSMDPVGAYEWLSCRSSHSYVPYLYGYTNYSRHGFRPHLVKVADIPALGNEGPIGSPIGGTGIAISANSKHKDLALEYAFWIASAECQSGVFFQAGGQPANMVAWQDEKCNQVSHNFFNDTINTLEASYLRPRHDGYMAFQDIGGDVIHACLTGQKDVPATVATINEAYERSFA